ncbi:H(+)/Cl(-) exchange transporter ClcA [Amorphus sp. 3PC139-8]|uniref:H(+)/Cl(-) exchange transporter ClcA n=1 Tax=Amorphus sp. 3PC139-8 TaxID=2735676 RepID=UPI00345C9260
MDPSHADSGRRSDLPYYVIAILVGAITGVIGAVLHLIVDAALHWPAALRASVEVGDLGLLLISGGIAASLGVVAVVLVRNFAPEAGGSGVQEIEGTLEGLRAVHWRRVLPVKFFGSLCSLGAGFVTGREGPTIHMGASVAQACAEKLKFDTHDSRGLLAAGAAAGLASAFNAPLAAILFVIEETRRQFPYSLKTYTAVMIASVTSGLVTEMITGRRPFMFITVPELPLSLLPAFVGLGLLLGVVGLLFNRCLIGSMDIAAAVGRRSNYYVVPAVVGFVIGILLIVRPEATMGGENLAVSLMTENLPLATMALIVVVRFIMTMASYSTNVPGGIFAPILALATAIGVLYGLVLDVFFELPAGAFAAFAIAAMGGLFSSTVRAPLVGVVLIAELTGAYSVLVPAIITCLLANVVADALGGKPIYEVLLDRTLHLAGTPRPPEDRIERTMGGWDAR